MLTSSDCLSYFSCNLLSSSRNASGSSKLSGAVGFAVCDFLLTDALLRGAGFLLVVLGSVSFVASSAWLWCPRYSGFSSRLEIAAARLDVHEVRPGDVLFFGDVIAGIVGEYIEYGLRYLSRNSLSSSTLSYSNWTSPKIARKRLRHIGKRITPRMDIPRGCHLGRVHRSSGALV
jgi:hypothetical protein